MTILNKTKKCSQCKKFKSLNEFGHNKRIKDGRHYLCKYCSRQNSKQYRQEHPEKAKAINKRYCEKHKEEIKERRKKYYYNHQEERKKYRENHKDKQKKYQKEYRKNNLESTKQKQQEYRQIHKEEIKIKAAQYYQKNKDRLLEDSRRYNEIHKEEQKQYRQSYYLENKEKISKQVEQYQQKNKDKVKGWRKNYCQRHKGEIKENYRGYNQGYSREYRKQHKEYFQEYIKKHQVKIRQLLMIWRQQHPEYAMEQYYKNKETILKSLAKKYREDLKFNLSSRMSSAIWVSLRNGSGKQNRHWESLVPYNLTQLKRHLAKTMPPNYSWQDFLEGKLHIDHRIPISIFSFTKFSHIDFQRCWALSNLQLLPAKENRKKHDKLLEHFQTCFQLSSGREKIK